MEKSRAATNDKIAVAARCVGKAQARVEVLQGIVNGGAGPRFALPSQSIVEGQPIGGAPPVLDVQTLVSVIQGSFRLVAYRRRNARALVDGSVKRGFVETRRCIEALEKDYKRMWRSPPEHLAHKVRAQEGRQVPEVRLKRIEQRE